MTKETITQQELKDKYSYDRETGIFTNKKNGRPALSKKGRYVSLSFKKNDIYIAFMAHRCVFLYETGEWPENHIDHINNNPSDNRLSNLRQCTKAENSYNKTVLISNKLGIKGVFYCKQKRMYVTQVSHQNKKVYFKRFKNVEDAVNAYNEVAKKYHGDYFSPSILK